MPHKPQKKLTRKFEQGEDLFEGEIIAEQQTEEVQARQDTQNKA